MGGHLGSPGQNGRGMRCGRERLASPGPSPSLPSRIPVFIQRFARRVDEPAHRRIRRLGVRAARRSSAARRRRPPDRRTPHCRWRSGTMAARRRSGAAPAHARLLARAMKARGGSRRVGGESQRPCASATSVSPPARPARPTGGRRADGPGTASANRSRPSGVMAMPGTPDAGGTSSAASSSPRCNCARIPTVLPLLSRSRTCGKRWLNAGRMRGSRFSAALAPSRCAARPRVPARRRAPPAARTRRRRAGAGLHPGRRCPRPSAARPGGRARTARRRFRSPAA